MRKQVSITYMMLSMLFTVSLITANIVGQKLISFHGLILTASIFIFPITYIVNNLIAEVWGYRRMRLTIWSGFLFNFLVCIVFRLSIWFPASTNYISQQSFTLILHAAERLTIASFIAFLLGSFINAYVMSKMKIWQHGRHFAGRAIISTVVGEGTDSLVFFTIAFSGILHRHALILLILGQATIKIAFEVLVLPLTNYVVKNLKKYEHSDVFDNRISYNPFKIKDV